MYNLRYHIISIVAIFLALALGLVLGGLIGGSAQSTSQNALVDTINNEFKQVREESAQLKTENEELSSFANAALTQEITGKLNDRTILVLGARAASSKQVENLVTDAGGTPLVAEVDSSRYDPKNKELASVRLADKLKKRYNTEDDLTALARGFAMEWSTQLASSVTTHMPTPVAAAASEESTHPVTAALNKDGILTLPDDFSDKTLITGLIDIAANEEGAPDPLALDLAIAIKDQDVPVLAATADPEAEEFVKAAWDEKISGTNLLGKPAGNWAVIALLTGAPQGLYGNLSGATNLFPVFVAK